MSESTRTNPLTRLESLDDKANKAADALTNAANRNEVWDKARKALKPAMSGLGQAQQDGTGVVDEAKQFYLTWYEKFDSVTSEAVRKIRTWVDDNIKSLKKAVDEKQRDLDASAAALEQAKADQASAAADYSKAQDALSTLPKDIAAQQKRVTDLQKSARDAGEKNVLIEAVVALEDLKWATGKLTQMVSAEYANGLWDAFYDAGDMLIAANDDLATAKAKNAGLDAALKEAQATYDTAAKKRLEAIKNRVADEPEGDKHS